MSVSKEIVKHWTKRMFECERDWEKAKARYTQVRESYIVGLENDPLTRDLALDRAGRDQRLKDAIKDTQYYRDEMMAYATLIQTWYSFPKGEGE